MKIQVQHGEATVASDRQRILNAIVGAKEQDAEPPLEHSHYDAVNATLHARFALATWKLTLEHGLSVEHYARVLAASHLTRMSLSFRSRRYVTDEMLKTLASAMPKTLKELSLVMTSCPGISDVGIKALVLKDLPLERLHLDLAKNEQLSDGGVEVLCSQLPRGLRHLWFSIGMNPALTDPSLQHLAAALSASLGASLESFFFSLAHCFGMTSQCLAPLQRAAPWMTRLTNYSLLCGKVAIEDADLAAVLRDLPQGLEEFFLDCWACEKLTEDILQTLAEAVLPLPRLTHLELTFGEIPAISGASGRKYSQRVLLDVPPSKLLEAKPPGVRVDYYS